MKPYKTLENEGVTAYAITIPVLVSKSDIINQPSTEARVQLMAALVRNITDSYVDALTELFKDVLIENETS